MAGFGCSPRESMFSPAATGGLICLGERQKVSFCGVGL